MSKAENIKNVNDLINSLSDELEPIKTTKHPLNRIVPLIVVSVLYVALMVALIGPRDDFMPKMMYEIDYVFEILLSLSIFISGAMALGWMSIPGMRGQSWMKTIPVTLSGIFVLWAALRIFFEWDQPFVFKLQNCSIDGLIMTFLPVAALIFTARRGTTTQPGWTSFITVLSFSGLGWAGLRFTCTAGTFLQSFVVHFVPFVIMGVLFGLFARRLYKW